MKKLILLLVLLPQFSLLFGQNDSIPPKKEKPKNNFKYSIGLDIVSGAEASEIVHDSHNINRFTGENAIEALNYHLYASINWTHSKILIGGIFGNKLHWKRRYVYDSYDNIDYRFNGFSVKGATIAYRAMPPAFRFGGFYFEHRINIYQETYQDSAKYTNSFGGPSAIIYVDYNDKANVTVINNYMGIGFTSPQDKRIVINISIALGLNYYYSSLNDRFEENVDYSTNGRQKRSAVANMMKIGLEYNFGKRKSK